MISWVLGSCNLAKTKWQTKHSNYVCMWGQSYTHITKGSTYCSITKKSSIKKFNYCQRNHRFEECIFVFIGETESHLHLAVGLGKGERESLVVGGDGLADWDTAMFYFKALVMITFWQQAQRHQGDFKTQSGVSFSISTWGIITHIT